MDVQITGQMPVILCLVYLTASKSFSVASTQNNGYGKKAKTTFHVHFARLFLTKWIGNLEKIFKIVVDFTT